MSDVFLSRTQFIPGIRPEKHNTSDDLTDDDVWGCRRKKILKTSKRNTCSSWAKQKKRGTEEHSQVILAMRCV